MRKCWNVPEIVKRKSPISCTEACRIRQFSSKRAICNCGNRRRRACAQNCAIRRWPAFNADARTYLKRRIGFSTINEVSDDKWRAPKNLLTQNHSHVDHFQKWRTTLPITLRLSMVMGQVVRQLWTWSTWLRFCVSTKNLKITYSFSSARALRIGGTTCGRYGTNFSPNTIGR